MESGTVNNYKQNYSSDPRYTPSSRCFVPIITEVVQLCVVLETSQKLGWTEACQNFVTDDILVGDIDFCMKKGLYTCSFGTDAVWGGGVMS